MLISKKTNYSKISQFFWQEHVEKASQVLSQSVATIDKYRKKTGLGESLGKMVRRQVRSLPDKTVNTQAVMRAHDRELLQREVVRKLNC
jgi:hypothetical protein